MRQFVIIVVHVQGERVQKQKRCRNGTGEPTMENKIYKSKCRYCGGNMYTHIHSALNIIGEQGYTISLKCEDCKSKAEMFTSRVDMIPTVESKLVEIYKSKGE